MRFYCLSKMSHDATAHYRLASRRGEGRGWVAGREPNKEASFSMFPCASITGVRGNNGETRIPRKDKARLTHSPHTFSILGGRDVLDGEHPNEKGQPPFPPPSQLPSPGGDKKFLKIEVKFYQRKNLLGHLLLQTPGPQTPLSPPVHESLAPIIADSSKLTSTMEVSGLRNVLRLKMALLCGCCLPLKSTSQTNQVMCTGPAITCVGCLIFPYIVHYAKHCAFHPPRGAWVLAIPCTLVCSLNCAALYNVPKTLTILSDVARLTCSRQDVAVLLFVACH